MTVPEHLHINGRTEDQSFTEDDQLYRSYTFEEYDFLEDLIKTETVKFPDFSCNWNRYSEPVDVRYRLNGRKKENNARKGFFEHDEFLAVREALPEYMKGFFTFAYKSGWRLSEIAGITWRQVNRNQGIVRLVTL